MNILKMNRQQITKELERARRAAAKAKAERDAFEAAITAEVDAENDRLRQEDEAAAERELERSKLAAKDKAAAAAVAEARRSLEVVRLDELRAQIETLDIATSLIERARIDYELFPTDCNGDLRAHDIRLVAQRLVRQILAIDVPADLWTDMTGGTANADFLGHRWFLNAMPAEPPSLMVMGKWGGYHDCNYIGALHGLMAEGSVVLELPEGAGEVPVVKPLPEVPGVVQGVVASNVLTPEQLAEVAADNDQRGWS